MPTLLLDQPICLDLDAEIEELEKRLVLDEIKHESDLELENITITVRI